MSFTFDKNKLNEIDQRSKLIVYGFLRNMYQKTSPTKHKLHNNVPELVYYICICYYYIPEYFTKHGSNLHLNTEQNLVVYSSTIHDDNNYKNDMNTVYGNIEISYDSNSDINEYIWIFEIISCSETISIGIDSSNKEFIDDAFYDCGYGPCYAHEFFYRYMNIIDDHTSDGSHGHKILEVGDKIKMILNVENKTLKYYTNNVDQKYPFNIDFGDDQNKISYFMAVSLYDGSVKLADFYKNYSPK